MRKDRLYSLTFLLSSLLIIHVNAQQGIDKSNNSLVVKLMSKYRNDILLYHNDEFGNSQGILFGENKLEKGIDIFDAHWKHLVTYYIPDSLNFVNFKLIDDYYYADSENKELNYIINFEVAFRKNIDPIIDQKSFNKQYIFNNVSYYNNGYKREVDIENKIAIKLSYLDQYSKSKMIPIGKFSEWKKIIDFEKMKYMLYITDFEKWDKNYLKRLSNLKFRFQDSTNLNFQIYRETLKYFTNLLTYLETGKPKPDFTDYRNTIQKHFQGKTRDYLECNLLLSAKEKDSGMLFTEKEYINLQKSFLSTCRTVDYLEYMKKTTNKNAGNGFLLKADNSTVDLKTVIGSYKVNYVDFWASWCAPCRAEMPESKMLRLEYQKKGINFIYISIDENFAAWERAVKQIGISELDSYLLAKGNKSALAQELKVTTIPRYIIIGQDGKIVDTDAPRPSDLKIRKIFDQLLKK